VLLRSERVCTECQRINCTCSLAPENVVCRLLSTCSDCMCISNASVRTYLPGREVLRVVLIRACRANPKISRIAGIAEVRFKIPSSDMTLDSELRDLGSSMHCITTLICTIGHNQVILELFTLPFVLGPSHPLRLELLSRRIKVARGRMACCPSLFLRCDVSYYTWIAPASSRFAMS